jgi:hypothetical protein
VARGERLAFVRPWIIAFISLSFCVGLGSCGYRVASKNRLDSGHKSIAVVPFENRTNAYEIEQILTGALVREFIQKSTYKVVNDPTDADLKLGGAVSEVRVSPVAFGQTSFGSTFLVTLRTSIYLQDNDSGELLFQNNSYVFREQYVINVDVKNFFSELNPALRRIADDFASSAVTSIMETF